MPSLASSGVLARWLPIDSSLLSCTLTVCRGITRRSVSVSALRHEALFYGLQPLVHKLDVCSGRDGCGGLLFSTRLAPPANDGPVVAVAGLNSLIAVAHQHSVTCYQFREASGWEVVAQSPRLRPGGMIEHLALNVKVGARGENVVALSTGCVVHLWAFGAGDTGAEPAAAAGEDAGDHASLAAERATVRYDLGVAVDDLLFIGNHVVASSQCGKVGVRNAMTLNWQVQDVDPICSLGHAGNMLLLGCANGAIYHVDLEKFRGFQPPCQSAHSVCAGSRHSPSLVAAAANLYSTPDEGQRPPRDENVPGQAA